MNAAGDALAYRRWRAPREDRGTLIEPSLADVGRMLADNARRDVAGFDVDGRSLADLARQARAELLAEARKYTVAYRDLPEPAATDTILLAGHQPQMFHCGVWAKNFVLSSLAARHRATAINLVVDNDTLKTPAIRVPGGSIAEPTTREIEFDAPRAETPFEDRPIADRSVFESFGRRAAEEIAPLVPHPILGEYWPLAIVRSRAEANLGACLAQARHQLEADFGLSTLEVPLSRVCETPSFAWFAACVLADLPRFREVYNSSVAVYRRVNRVRSVNHPVPDLVNLDDWLEAPFWIWRRDDHRRRRLFVRRTNGEMLLSDRAGLELRLPVSQSGGLARTAEALHELPRKGIRLRTRALTTTLWARLALSDLFIHGIGGAKYDQVTDLIVERFFGLRPPGYLVVTATLRLPIAGTRATADDLRRVDTELREMAYHPERFLPTDSGAAAPPDWGEHVANKRSAIAEIPSPATARARCQTIRAANAALQPWIEPRREELTRKRLEVADSRRAAGALDGREYAFCLYPRERLADFLLEIGEANA